MTNVVCQDCDIEYAVKSKEAEEDGIIPAFCPFCGFETTDELDFGKPNLKTLDDEDDWDNWHPDDRFD
jgi:hypothetical protein